MIASTILIPLFALLTLHGASADLKGSKKGPNKPTKDPVDIFPSNDEYIGWAICKGRITTYFFPNLKTPMNSGGCVRYYRGIDITGVVTEQHFFFSDGVLSACDCIVKCLQRPASCTNWVYKHTFMGGDGGFRSCTLYSLPNLPSNVTLEYDLAKSAGFDLLQPANNPQAGAPAPLTFLDAGNTQQDNFGVSGFVVQDANNFQYC